jgi:mRNA interferase RelE/StbE
MYRVEFSPIAGKEFKKLAQRLPVKTIERLIQALQGLSQDPRPEGIRKLTDDESYRIRIGDFRIIFDIHDDIKLVSILHVSRRSEDTYKYLG